MARQQFLRFLASSPLMAGSASLASVSALLATFPETSLAQSYDVLRAPVSSQGAFIPRRRWPLPARRAPGATR